MPRGRARCVFLPSRTLPFAPAPNRKRRTPNEMNTPAGTWFTHRDEGQMYRRALGVFKWVHVYRKMCWCLGIAKVSKAGADFEVDGNLHVV